MSSSSSSSAKKPLLILSFDVEAYGDSPAHNAMCSFGAVGFEAATGKEVCSLQLNVHKPAGTVVDQRCQEEFWDKNPKILAFVQTNQITPEAFSKAIADFWNTWSAKYRIKWMANPSAYDWQWLNFYYNKHKTDDMPNIGYTARCMGSILHVLSVIYGFDEDEFEDRHMKRLAGPDHVPHNPEHDARVQGKMYLMLMGMAEDLQIKSVTMEVPSA